jgi:homoserine dehydrogenase
LCLLGVGSVNRTLVRLLADREKELRERRIAWRVTGIASRSLGWIADPGGLDLGMLTRMEALVPGSFGASLRDTTNVRDWLQAAKSDVLFEATSLNVESGQPAVDHIRAALELGGHAITANKGPVVYAYEELTRLASERRQRFLFESAVMDGVPIFSLFRENLPALQLKGFRGILNSTTNVILGGMEEGLSFEAALKKAQAIGVAETNASHDVEGWDAAVKVAALVIVLMGQPIQLSDVQREGIGKLTGEQVRVARAAGTPYKLVCRAQRTKNGIEARVSPEQVPLRDPLAWVAGTSSIVYFETDIFPGLVITEENPGLSATAYGMLTDFIKATGH